MKKRNKFFSFQSTIVTVVRLMHCMFNAVQCDFCLKVLDVTVIILVWSTITITQVLWNNEGKWQYALISAHCIFADFLNSFEENKQQEMVTPCYYTEIFTKAHFVNFNNLKSLTCSCFSWCAWAFVICYAIYLLICYNATVHIFFCKVQWLHKFCIDW